MQEELKRRQNKEKSRIAKIYKKMPKDQYQIAEKLIERTAYMLVSLMDMEEKIAQDGLVVKMQQGDYEIERAHPLLQAYNSMVKNFNATIKQLDDMMPDNTVEKAGQTLMMFAAKPQPKAVAKRD